MTSTTAMTCSRPHESSLIAQLPRNGIRSGESFLNPAEVHYVSTRKEHYVSTKKQHYVSTKKQHSVSTKMEQFVRTKKQRFVSTRRALYSPSCPGRESALATAS